MNENETILSKNVFKTLTHSRAENYRQFDFRSYIEGSHIFKCYQKAVEFFAGRNYAQQVPV